ncbi:MAG: response regulator transcription factor [Chitinophagaceae bacterium]
MRRITILLVDDHKLIRDSWAYILKSDARFSIVGEAGTAEEAVAIAKEKHPGIVLMDINMQPVDGFEATKRIHHHSPESKIIGVSMYSIPAYAKKLLQNGAMGYVTKNSSKEEMIDAIMEVSDGHTYVCNEIKNILAEQQLEDKHSQREISALTQREMDIIMLIKEGNSSREIAEKLNITYKTVEVHRYNILKKLNLKNTASLVNFINSNTV